MKPPTFAIPPHLDQENTSLYLKLLLKQKEIEHVQALSESKEKLLKGQYQLALTMKDVIVNYAKASSGNKYSPMAVSNIASSFAAISTGNLPSDNTIDLSEFEDKTIPSQITIPQVVDSERIKIAKAQGFRWNDHDVMPANPEIAHKRVKEWEDQIALGRASEVFHKPYDKLLADTSKAFVTGLCMALEESLGIDKPLSPYLKKRYGKLQTSALKNQGVEIIDSGREVKLPEPVTTKCPLSPEEIVEGMYQAVYKGVSIDVHHDNVTSVWKRIAEEDYAGDFRKIPGYTLAKSATLGGIPTSIEWESENERERTIHRRRFTAEQREKYADQIKNLVDKYLDSVKYGQ